MQYQPPLTCCFKVFQKKLGNRNWSNSIYYVQFCQNREKIFFNTLCLFYSSITIYEKMKQKSGNKQNGHSAVRHAIRTLWTVFLEGKFLIWLLPPHSHSMGLLGKVEFLESHFRVFVSIAHFP